MKLTIPDIVRKIELSEYAPEFGEACIYVWANPTRELRASLVTMIQEKTTPEELQRVFSELWSKGPEDTRMSPEDVKTLYETCFESTPQLWDWIIVKTTQILRDHWVGRKKATP